MNLTFRSLALTLTLAALANGLGSTALADTYIKGTQVSYNKDINAATKKNESSVYVDEASDTDNKNYAEFFCDEGAPIFYLNSGQPLVTQKQFDDDKTPDLFVRVDDAKPIKVYTVGANTEDKPNLKLLALDDKFDAQMLRLFQNARNKVIISMTRYDKKTLNFVFYPKGINDGLKAINNCKQM